MTDKPTKEIFNKLNQEKFRISQREIARNSGLGTSLVNRFVSTDSDINSTNLLTLVAAMPLEFQKAYWRKILPTEVFAQPNWEALIEEASIEELIIILQAASDRLRHLTKGAKVEVSEKKLCA